MFYIITDEIVRFHTIEYDEISCTLNSIENNPHLFREYSTPVLPHLETDCTTKSTRFAVKMTLECFSIKILVPTILWFSVVQCVKK